MKKAGFRLAGSLLTALMLLGTATSALATEWQTPCTTEPYDYQFQDDTRNITINRISEGDITYFVADVQLTSAAGFQTALSGGKPNGDLESLTTIVARTNAVIAVNGDDYATHKYGTIIRNGGLIRAHNTTRNMLMVDADGNMSVITDRSGENAVALGKQLIADKVWQTFEFGPELVRDGKDVEFSEAFDVISTNPDRKEPRTAIGQIGPLHYIIIVVDGRQDGYSSGISLQNLQQLFLKYGAQTAMNLDGGGSTEMWFQGQIINKPSGGEERYVSDIICF